MSCLKPLRVWRSSELHPVTKNRTITFDFRKAFYDLPEVVIPCRQCSKCRLEFTRQWAIRASHEASLYEKNCFVTLTYRNECLPPNGSLDYLAPVAWMKRLRERYGSGIRSLGCAEYGKKLGRPHYHILLFNFDFPDKVFWKIKKGHRLFTSDALEELWPFGFSTIGEVTFESAAYVSKYMSKRITGRNSSAYYHAYCDLETRQEKYLLAPEKAVCRSMRPGIGKPWLEKFMTDVYPADSVVLRGKEFRPPKYYDSIFDVENPDEMANIKLKRRMMAKEMSDSDVVINTRRALTVEEFNTLGEKNKKRDFENES